MDDPIIDKMDALIGRYQTNPFAPAANPPEPLVMPEFDTVMNFPVLTDIVQLGDAVFNNAAPTPPTTSIPSQEINAETQTTIATHVLQSINQQLQTQITNLIAPQLQQAMDDTIALLLPQLTINIEHIVHETLINEFKRYGITLKQPDDSV
jgi:DNA phosphorothioation-dependent restriction protein DptG